MPKFDDWEIVASVLFNSRRIQDEFADCGFASFVAAQPTWGEYI